MTQTGRSGWNKGAALLPKEILMKTRTLTVSLAADRDAVFAFLAQIEQLPEWAPAFCRELRREGHHWRAITPGGEDYLALVADPRTGVMDLFIGVRPDEMTLLPLRVIRQSDGAVVICTFLQPAGWAEDVFARYCDALLAGLRGLAKRFGGGEVEGIAAGAGQFYPSVVTRHFFETWDFYTTHLGFRTVCQNDVYVHLSHPDGAQLGVLHEELDGLPAELVSATDGRGVWLNREVADADAEHARMCAAGIEIAEPPEDKPWGNRQFLIRDPNGMLIAIAHRIPAAAEALASLPAAS